LSHRFRFQPHAQRAILGWLVLHRPMSEKEAIADQDSLSESTFKGLEEWLEGRCAEQIGTPEDQTTVADFVSVLSEDLARETDSRVRNRMPHVTEAFQGLAAHVQRHVEDYRQTPHDPVRRLDKWAREVTVADYRDQPDAAIRDGIAARIAGIETVIIAVKGVPVSASGTWRVHGETTFRVGGGPAWRIDVSLGVALDRGSWHAASYLLLHEYISHGAQGPWGSSCVKPGPDDLYAEGWMDVVAHLLHTIYLHGGTGDDLSAAPEDPGPRTYAANGYHHERCEVRLQGAAGRHHGARVARSLNHLLLEGRAEPADEAFLRLSLQLNASAASHLERDLFVRGVETAIEVDAPIKDWVQRYRETGSIEELTRPVLDLVAGQTKGRTAFDR
jgi:hypothetical protein